VNSTSIANAVVGTRIAERCFIVDQSLITRYAEVSGDRNPLHLDPEFAKTTKFGRVIAHGMMTLAFVSQAMSDAAEGEWEKRGQLSVTFVAPVFVGDEVVVRLDVSEIRAEITLCKVECSVGDKVVLVGEAAIRKEHANG
jgi:3-hydroxybutyryl-CoA dehydratase